MLTRLYVTNYRCLVNFEFKPNAKQLIIGRNGTGKSTVFDVLALLRDVAVRGKPCEEYLGDKTRTRWQNVVDQRFELDVRGNGGNYRYTLVVYEQSRGAFELRSATKGVTARVVTTPRPRVKEETLEFDGRPLFRFSDGEIGLFNDQQKPEPSATFPFDGYRSGLAIVEARWENTKLTWFKQWLGGLLQVQINPWAMSARSEHESREPATNLSNFADWYRHLRLESGESVFHAIADLREAIPGFQSLDAKEAGLDVRVLQATLANQEGKEIDLPFHDLSEGQRALIALYVLLHCAVGQVGTLLIDEPDNFIALAEIQPWLMKLLDRVDETGGQAILVSHHPELLDQLAGQGGVLLERPGGRETRVRPFDPSDDSGLTASEIIARGWEEEDAGT